MKRFLVIAAAVMISLCAVKGAVAETVGNPIDINLPAGKGVYSSQLSDFITLNVGFDTEILLENKFTYDSAVTTQAPELEGQYYMGHLGCMMFNRIQPYVKFGYSDLEMSWKDANGIVKVDAEPSLAWGVGIKAYLWEFEGLGLKVFSTASYLSTKPTKMRKVTVGGTTGGVTQKKFEVYEKQATLGLSRAFDIPGWENAKLVPYIGGAWSDTVARVRVTTQNAGAINSGAKEQKDNFGVFLGTEIIFMDNVSFNVEGRFIDQKAVNLGLTALF